MSAEPISTMTEEDFYSAPPAQVALPPSPSVADPADPEVVRPETEAPAVEPVAGATDPESAAAPENVDAVGSRPGKRRAKDPSRPYNAQDVRTQLIKSFALTREVELTLFLQKLANTYGLDIRDLRKDRKALLQELKHATAKTATPATEAVRARIVVGTDLEKMHDEAISALAPDAKMYRRGCGGLEKLVRVVGSTINVLPVELLPERLTSAADWVDGHGAPTIPSAASTKAIHARGEYPALRALQGVVARPTLLPDGRVLVTPGYDPASCLYYQPDGEWPPLEDLPSTQEELLAVASRARDVLIDGVVDFPFATTTDRAVWLAELLTVEARFFLKECFPHFLHTANVKGTGKGALAKLTGLIASGAEPETRFLPSGSNGEEELEKRITAVAMINPALVFFDEVQIIRSRTLQMVATSRMYAGRKLGASEDFRGRIDFVTIYAGNNTSVCGDMTRRTIECRLESQYANPATDRPVATYAHPERAGDGGTFMQWAATASRGLHLEALTMLRAYLASRSRADAPEVECGSLGSFEEWSSVVARALVWIGEPDVTRAVAGDEDDDETNQLRAVVDAWQAAFGPVAVTAGEALQYVKCDLSHLPAVMAWRESVNPPPDAIDFTMGVDITLGGPVVTDADRSAALRTAILAACPADAGKGGDGLPNAERLGWWLKKMDRRPVVRCRFVSARRENPWGKIWSVEHVSVPAPGCRTKVSSVGSEGTKVTEAPTEASGKPRYSRASESELFTKVTKVTEVSFGSDSMETDNNARNHRSAIPTHDPRIGPRPPQETSVASVTVATSRNDSPTSTEVLSTTPNPEPRCCENLGARATGSRAASGVVIPKGERWLIPSGELTPLEVRYGTDGDPQVRLREPIYKPFGDPVWMSLSDPVWKRDGFSLVRARLLAKLHAEGVGATVTVETSP